MSTKTRSAPLDRAGWLATVDATRGDEAAHLLQIFADVTGWEPRLWGPSMVGFGRYTYRYDSGHSGETLVVGFSPRKGDLSFYGLTTGAEAMLAQLGPHRTGKGCLYIKRLAAVDETVLCALIRSGVTEISTHWPVVKV